MPIIIFEYGFDLFTVLVAAFLLIVIPYTLILHFFVPKALLEKYFRPPHFGEFERHLFTGIPYAPMRTIMFMWVIVYPRVGRKRKLTEMYKDVPHWFRIASKIGIYGVYIAGVGSMVVLALLGIMVFIG
jgi:hypothetical protein